MTRRAEFTVFLVDDDASVRDSLSLMLAVLGYRISAFESAEALLESWRDGWTGCVVADLRLPGKSGLELQAELGKRGIRVPFVLITAHGNVPSARAAFMADAVDFLEKPFDDSDLTAAIEKCLERESRRVEGSESAREQSELLARLTPREREVLMLVGRGLHAKEIAASLHISPRTVDVYKARLMEKLRARNAAELVRLALGGEPRGG
jgi:RNA polymerase sigma factor (sigma-70 family)